MKYIKISFILIAIILFVYFKSNKEDDILFEDKLSMYIFVKSHENIEDILVDLSSQIESFDEYIYNVYYSRNNKFLIKNKDKLQFDKENIDYSYLLEASSITDFNNKVAEIIELYFLDYNSKFHLTKKYLLRDFLIRINTYFEAQISLFHKTNNSFKANSMVEDFILGPQYLSDYKKEYYIMAIEFLDLNSIINFKNLGMDTIINSILDYNSKIFNSDLTLYNPYLDKNHKQNLEFQLVQRIKEFDSLEEAINCHKSLMLSDNMFLVQSIYDYYYDNEFLDNGGHYSAKLSQKISNSNYNISYDKYKTSLLLLEEKLIALQSDDLTDDRTISSILYNLVGDGDVDGFYSKYIDSINNDSTYLLNNINRLFSHEIESLFDEIVQSESKFDLSNIPVEIKKHLFRNNSFRVRYFVE